MPTPEENRKAVVDAFTLRVKADGLRDERDALTTQRDAKAKEYEDAKAAAATALASVEPILTAATRRLSVGAIIPITGTGYCIEKTSEGLRVARDVPTSLEDLIK